MPINPYQRAQHNARQAALIARLPRGLRPKLAAAQVLDLDLVHHTNLDLIAKGQADEDILWHWVGGVLTWHRVAQMLGQGEAEMLPQVEMAARLVTRYGATGRVIFSGPDYQLAKDGVAVMDQLAAIVDQPTASAAADWSQAQVDDLAARCRPADAAA